MVTRQFSNCNWSKLTLKCAKINYFTECKALNHFVSMQYTKRLLIFKSHKKFKHVWRLNYCVNYFDAARHCNTENELKTLYLNFHWFDWFWIQLVVRILLWLVESRLCKLAVIAAEIEQYIVFTYITNVYIYIRGDKLSVRGYLGLFAISEKK